MDLKKNKKNTHTHTEEASNGQGTMLTNRGPKKQCNLHSRKDENEEIINQTCIVIIIRDYTICLTSSL